MFISAKITLGVEIVPSKFNLPLNIAVQQTLDSQLADRVLPDVGLGICFDRMVSIEKSFVVAGSGNSHTRATFYYIFFRPFEGETIEGSLYRIDSEQIQVSLTFFNDIYIQNKDMLPYIKYDPTRGKFVLEVTMDDETIEMFMEIGEKIKFKVKEEIFQDPGIRSKDNTGEQPQIDEEKINPSDFNRAPFNIVGTINQEGLGMTSWWQPADDDDEEEEEAEMDEVENGTQ